jgi:A/G-specific adenine glycosylase
MLQQTQVERVIPFYERFIEKFPTPAKLATANLSEVLQIWSGLGYNRRAKFLQEAAKQIMKEYRGKFPNNAEDIEKLRGVGHYTARAVAAFAYNKPEVFVETNIRTIFIYYCFAMSRRRLDILVSDAEILPLVAEALKKSKMQPRNFYAALMDYGSYLKKKGIKLNLRSKHYNKQSKFEGSYRQLRGAILRALLQDQKSIEELIDITGRKKSDILRVIVNLSDEGLIKIEKGNVSILD